MSSQQGKLSTAVSNRELSKFKLFSLEIQNFLKYFSELTDKSALHGLRFILSSKYMWIERLFWLILVILSSFAAYSISLTQYERYVANPTVISLERDYRDWNGTLPAITLCYHRRIDEKQAENLIKRFWNIEKGDEEFTYFYDYVKTVVYLNDSLAMFNRFANDKRLEFISMLTIAKEVHPVFSSAVSSFDTNAEFVLNQVITEKGICFTVNSVLWPLISTMTSNRAKLNLQTKPLSCYFLKNQCYMKLDVFNPTVFIAIHSPYEIPAESSLFFDMGMTDEIESNYNMLETVTSEDLKKLSVAQRRCYFIDESTQYLPVYSFNACKLLCRARAAIKKCGCRPYYYPFVNGTSCSPSGLLCLSVNRWPKSVSCDCAKTCVEIVYTQNSLKKINWAVDGGIPFTQKSSFRYEIIAPRMRLKRDILFSYEDLIVSFGGVAALFLGLNFWSLADSAFYVIKSFIKYVYQKILKK